MASPVQRPDLVDQLPLCFPELCERLTCGEALPIRGLCRGACEAFGPVALVAAAFAAARHVLPRGAPGALATWMRAWQACAQAAEAKGHSVGAWAPCGNMSISKDLRILFAEVVDEWVAEGEACLGLLAMARCTLFWPDGPEASLVLLSDGSFLSCQLHRNGERPASRDRVSFDAATLHRARTLAELASLWDFDEEGDLRFVPELPSARKRVRERIQRTFLVPWPLWQYQQKKVAEKVAGLLVRGRPPQPARAPEAALPRAPEPSGAAASCHAESCYQEVVHWESAAEIPPEEAQAISRQLWAGHVQRLAELLPGQPESSEGTAMWDLASEDSASRQPATELWDTVFLVGLSRVCDALRDGLQNGRELEPVRAAAAAAGHSWQHASGAAVFLYPEQYPRVLEALREEQLRPHQVLIVEAFLPLLYHEILQLPSRADVRPCSRRPHMLVQEDGSVVAAVERTFIRAPASARRRPESVVQSLRGRREGENPRRRVP